MASHPKHLSPERTIVGFVTVLLLVVVGIARIRVLRAHAFAAARMRQSSERAATHPERAETVAAASLASAVLSLAEISGRLQAATEPVDPPLPTDFDSPTECMSSYLSDVEIAPDSLDFVCRDTELWSIERKAYVRLESLRGEAAREWVDLGHYSLAALASLRSGCCIDPPPLTAVVPGLWCGTLGDKVRAFGPAPSNDGIRNFDDTMACLKKRGAHLPDRWQRVSRERTARAFAHFVEVARRRNRATLLDARPLHQHRQGDAP